MTRPQTPQTLGLSLLLQFPATALGSRHTPVEPRLRTTQDKNRRPTDCPLGMSLRSRAGDLMKSSGWASSSG